MKETRPKGRVSLCSQVLDPFSLFDHGGTDEAFHQVCALADGVQGDDGHIRKPAQAEGQGNTDTPDKAAVKQEGDQSLAAAAQRKIGCVGIGIEGHHYGADADEASGQLPHLLCGVVKLREQAGN